MNHKTLVGKLHELSLAGMGVAAGLHVGANAAVKRMLKPGSRFQKIGSSIYQAGVRAQHTGRAIHPALLRASEVLAGPEASHIYRQGLESTREARKAMATHKHLLPQGSTAHGVAEIATGHRSPRMDKILNSRFIPKGSADEAKHLKSSKAGHVGGALAGIGAAMIDPVTPAANAGRAILADTSIGKRVLKRASEKGYNSGEKKGVMRHIVDHLVSPSINAARDVGATAGATRRRFGFESVRPGMIALATRLKGGLFAHRTPLHNAHGVRIPKEKRSITVFKPLEPDRAAAMAHDPTHYRPSWDADAKLQYQRKGKKSVYVDHIHTGPEHRKTVSSGKAHVQIQRKFGEHLDRRGKTAHTHASAFSNPTEKGRPTSGLVEAYKARGFKVNHRKINADVAKRAPHVQETVRSQFNEHYVPMVRRPNQAGGKAKART
jgi:hypothetical protein